MRTYKKRKYVPLTSTYDKFYHRLPDKFTADEAKKIGQTEFELAERTVRDLYSKYKKDGLLTKTGNYFYKPQAKDANPAASANSANSAISATSDTLPKINYSLSNTDDNV
ncbi:MAG: hypothetical protein IPO62_04555 [Saprospiraceae bacterium]|nr:hypothetical protein [Saprospiraceae bacterium]